jgi:exodeoxyribonuclease V gamma subunit
MLPAVSGESGLHLYTSNQLEKLADALATELERPLSDPFSAETVIVQSLGMRRWLTQELARRHGICANISYRFAERFVAGLMDAALPGRAAAAFFARENLTWCIMHLLPALVRQKEFLGLRRYLEQPRPELRRYQLASRIANVFDRYLAFRPQMIRDWDKGAGKDWQAILWGELVKAAPGLHLPALAGELRTALQQRGTTVPERVSFFGISTLPPFYVEFLEELARSTAVHLFLMRPTPEWWGDFRSEKEQARARRKTAAQAEFDLQFETANPLLKSSGKLGREFLEKVTELNPVEEQEHFCAPAGETILAQIQRDIFELRNPMAGGAAAPGGAGSKLPAGWAERSLQFHSCHSPMREMEVLHDQLLALFEKFHDLKPHDIVVMAPDITVYAPFIEAVFSTAPEALRIPFSIADRGERAENGVIDTFLRILELAGSRLPASGVLNLLESAALRERFDLTEPNLEIIRTWIEETGIRWGIDGAHRAALGLPEFGENSWRAGLDRLLLGYAAPAGGERLFEGILAYDKVEGNLAETLGHFAEFAEALFTTVRDLEAPRTLIEWEETLHAISLSFFPKDDEREPALRQLRRVLGSLGETARLSGFAEAVPLDVILTCLGQALARTESGSGFLAGKLTFCALKPMRAVPFRVVCLVGMNDTDYPRHDRAPGFDLVAKNPRPGDRTTRDDDRYLFLEALLSARDVFYLSYVGQSIRDNSAIPPSVLVSELLDYSGSRPTTHPLQPFSEKYFNGAEGLFSYSKENCAASEVAGGPRQEPARFMRMPIGEPEEEWHEIELEKLVRFYKNPAKFFLEQRLSVRLPRLDNLLEDSEPVALGGIPKYQLEQDLLDRAITGEVELETLVPALRAGGELPPGHAGALAIEQMRARVEAFAAAVREHVKGAPDEARVVEIGLDEFTIRGRLAKLHDGRLIHFRLTTRKPQDLLGAWAQHLVANYEAATKSVLITTDKEGAPVEEWFDPVEPESAQEHLRDLVRHYWRGLREPLPLFPRSSQIFAEKIVAGKDVEAALGAARAKWRRTPEPWEPDKGEKPESLDPHLQLVFRHVADPFDDDWQQVAQAVYEPPLKAIRK